MNKLKYIFALILMFGGYVPSAQAQIKFDISNLTNKISEQISKWQEQAQKLFEQSTTMQTMVSYGKGAAEAAKKIKEGVDAAQSMISDVKGAVTDLQDAAMSAVSDIQGEVGGLKGDITGAVGSATGSISDEVSNVTSKTQNAQKIVQLTTEIANIEAEYKAGAEVRKKELDGKIKAYNENNETHQKMIAEDPSQKEALEAQIAANNEAIRALQEEFDKKEVEEKASSDSRVSEIKAELSSLEKAAAQESLDLAEEGFSSVKVFLNKGSAAELDKTIADNFISANEDETSSTINRVRKHRSKVAAEDTLKVLAFAVKVKASLPADNENIDKLADDVPSMDGSSGAIAMDTQLKIENMKALLLYVQVLINDLKMRSAQDLAALTTYKLRNPDKDVAQFNLDDYKYKKASKLNVNSLKNIASNASSLGDLKDKVSDKISAVKEVSDTLKTAISATSEISGMVASYTNSKSNNTPQESQLVAETEPLTSEDTAESTDNTKFSTLKDMQVLSDSVLAGNKLQTGNFQAEKLVSSNSLKVSDNAVKKDVPMTALMTATGKPITRQAFGQAQAVKADAAPAKAGLSSLKDSIAQSQAAVLQAGEGLNTGAKVSADKDKVNSLQESLAQRPLSVLQTVEGVGASAISASAESIAAPQASAVRTGLSSLKESIAQSQAAVLQAGEGVNTGAKVSAVKDKVNSLQESMAQRPQSALQAVEGVGASAKGIAAEGIAAPRADLESLKADKLKSKAEADLAKDEAKAKAQLAKESAKSAKEAVKAEVKAQAVKADAIPAGAGLSSLKESIAQSQAAVLQAKENVQSDVAASKETIQNMKNLIKTDVKADVKSELNTVKTNIQAVQSNAKAVSLDSNSRGQIGVLK